MASIFLTLIPLLLAADYGGVLHWTHYPLVLAAVGASVLATVSLLQPASSGGYRRFAILSVLGLWAVYGWVQTRPLSPSLISHLSPGSVAAYTDWLEPILGQDQVASTIPVSLAVNASKHAVAILVVLIAVIWAAIVVLDTRLRVGALLVMISIGATACSAYGFWVAIDPGLDHAGTLGFGTFVNRNNAALFLNFGLAASLGLLSWRLNALTGQAVDDDSFQINDLVSLVSDRDSLIGVICAAACVSGLLVCGSRGGMAATLIGVLFAFGWVRQKRGYMGIPVVGVVIGICVALMLAPAGFGMMSVDRFDLISSQGKASLLDNGRLLHWQDGWRSALEHFPAGSGFATYAYAYLPHQQSSPQAWFHHADNLWLEMFVEQGVMGVLFALALVWIIIRSLRQLSESADPIDQGLRTTGWFAFGAVLFSQFWDFGLIIPANLFAFGVLVAAMVARGEVVRVTTTDSDKPVSLFPSWKQRVFSVGVGVAAIGAVVLCLRPLRNDAQAESVVQTISFNYDKISKSKSALDESIKLLRPIADGDSPEAMLMMAKLQHERGRIAEVYEAEPPTPEDALDTYRNTGILIRRLRWQDRDEKAKGDIGTSESSQYYKESLRYARRTLQYLPYSIEPRASLIYLDFVYRDREKSRAALEQLSKLQTRVPEQLIRIALMASDGGEYDVAKAKWRSALEQEPASTERAMKFVQSQSTLTVADIVPDLPANQRLAARYMLENAALDETLKAQAPSFLAAALGKLKCEECEGKSEKSECHELAGDILFSIDRSDDSFPHYVTAIQAQPSDAQLRTKYIDRLRLSGNREDALKAAKRARADLPSQPRFQRIIEEMAEQDLIEARMLQQQRNKPATPQMQQ